jgi:CHAD domain-containing protein
MRGRAIQGSMLDGTTAGLSSRKHGLREHLDQCLETGWRRFRQQFKRARQRPSERVVHQLRVEARRVLAVLAVLQSLLSVQHGGKGSRRELEALQARIKSAFRGSARLRDTHVRGLLMEKEMHSFPALKPLRKALRKKEKRLKGRLRKCLDGVRPGNLGKSVRRLRKTLTGVLHNTASEERSLRLLLKEVNRAHRHTVVLLQRAHTGSPMRIHCVRVAFKKFRYEVEVLEPLIAGLSTRELQHMRRWQDTMGQIQDTAMLQTYVAKRASKKPDPTLDRFRQRLQDSQQRFIDQFLASADELLEFWPPARGPTV